MGERADVRIRWLTTTEGGRVTPVHVQAWRGAQYKPHFRMGPDGAFLGVSFLDGNPPVLEPGCEGTATVALIFAEDGVDYSGLVTGAEFNVVEGRRIVGRGTILRRWTTDEDWRKYTPRE